jgi:phage tail tape-measure protein
LEIVIRHIHEASEKSETYGDLLKQRLEDLLSVWDELKKAGERDSIESTAKPLFQELIHLYQMALMVEEKDADNEKWIEPALNYMASVFDNQLKLEEALKPGDIQELIGWDY